MVFRRLTLTNYALFRGEQVLDLTPEPARPIILVGGKNGCGKTSILEAIRLCIYGPAAYAERPSKDAYAALLGRKIHSSPTLLIQPSFASVALAFDYADAGRISHYEVRRSWERGITGRITERLQVSLDGVDQSDLTLDQWNDFARELLPPGVSNLFFFDGEKIQHLADDISAEAELAHSVKSLLGTDLVERLQSDLSIFRARLSRVASNGSGNGALEAISAEISATEARIRELSDVLEKTEKQMDELRVNASRIEARIAAEGGAFARNREGLISRREAARATITTLEASIRQLVGGLLPFAIIPQQCEALRSRLILEQEQATIKAQTAALSEARQRIFRALDRLPEFKGLAPEERAGKRLLSVVKEVVTKSLEPQSRLHGMPEQTRTRHSLSAIETSQLLHWLEAAMSDVPARLSALGAELELAYRELQRAEDGLKKVPADDVLGPLIAEFQELNKALGQTSAQATIESEALRSEQTRLSELRRKLAAEADRLEGEASSLRRVTTVAKVQSVLDTFKDVLLKRKLHDLETEVTHCFNSIARKTDTVKRVAIDPTTFEVSLHGRDGIRLQKDRLSAGEKQVYAIAMLWALARTSGRPLPVIIDTPLGRLDTDHRRLLVERYFPIASHQTIILSTDTEVDHAYLESLKPHVARVNRLDYDMTEQCTSVANGYFFGSEQ